MKKILSLALTSTMFVAGAALAQTSTAPSATPAPAAPMGTAPMNNAPMNNAATTSAAPAASTAMSAPMTGGKFVTEQGKDEYLASKFIGLDIYGPENNKVGDISEVLIDASGNAKAIVIGVGGFLGIGQKNVAVPWSAVQWKLERPAATTATAPAGTAAPMGGTVASGTTAPMGAAAPMGTATTANTAAGATTASTTPARSPAEQAAFQGYPDHGMISLTKQELQDAPAFKYMSDTRR